LALVSSSHHPKIGLTLNIAHDMQTLFPRYFGNSSKTVITFRYQHDVSQFQKREVASGKLEFSVPDTAISKLIYSGIIRRNIKKIPSSSYAYMPDRNVFDALLHLDDFDRRSNIFATQIDLEKFFDKIPHDYLDKLIHSDLLHTTTLEKRVLNSFMTHDSFEILGGVHKPLPKRSIGTPQGSSISLILSNLANHELDRELSLLSGKLVRYADDVVALSTTYEQALAVEHPFYWHCEHNGLFSE
jgi:RNA-directed DNA polymerase